ncbi:membrane protein insertase YidC, partial [Candidatus Dependentiae bacterium]|nr:membrane protein insertase YidC [Candidatus Dependentiae bacterium]
TSLGFNDYLGQNKLPLQTISGEAVTTALPAFTVLFEDIAPLAYERVQPSRAGLNVVALQARHKGWLITKEYVVDRETYKVDISLSFDPIEQNVLPVSPRLLLKAPFVSEFNDDKPSAFVYNENRDQVEKKAAGAEEGFIWYWQTKKPLIGAQNKYFVHALTADLNKFIQRAYFCRPDGNDKLHLVLEGPEIKEKASWNLSFYLGPKVYTDLIQVDERLGTVFAGGWFAWITKLMLKFLDYVSKYIKNLGLAIIVLAILLKLPLVPLSIYSRIKMEKYQKHAPIITRIRAKFKNDPQMQLQEVARYHTEHNLSPSTPMIGCLPLLLQLPVMYSLYDILNNSIQLYQAPFFGWIVDLSAKDPFYVIPILMGITMVWQQMMAPVNDEKQRVAMFFVSIVMTVVFSGLPVGLVLYWLINNVLTIVEDYARRLFFS